jgi:hypothetical protein
MMLMLWLSSADSDVVVAVVLVVGVDVAGAVRDNDEDDEMADMMEWTGLSVPSLLIPAPVLQSERSQWEERKSGGAGCSLVWMF